MKNPPTSADQILRVMCVIRCENSKLIFYKSIEFEYIFLLILVFDEQFDVIFFSMIWRC